MKKIEKILILICILYLSTYDTCTSYVFKNENKHFDYVERDTKPRIIFNKEIIERAISLECCHSHAGRLSRLKLDRVPQCKREYRVFCRKFQESHCASSAHNM